MPKLSNILNDSDEVTVPTPDGDITIEYYPSRVTQKMTAQFLDFQKKVNRKDEDVQQVLHDINALLVTLMKGWDLEDEVPCGECGGCMAVGGCHDKKTVMFPFDPDRMSELPVWLISDVTKALMDPNRLAPQKKKRK